MPEPFLFLSLSHFEGEIHVSLDFLLNCHSNRTGMNFNIGLVPYFPTVFIYLVIYLKAATGRKNVMLL